MIGLINGLIEIKVFTLKIQWFKNEERSGAVGLVKVLDWCEDLIKKITNLECDYENSGSQYSK